MPEISTRTTTRETILAAVDRLPPFPPVAARVLQLINDPESSAADLARAISRDQPLTARVLRAGNSSFYGFTQQVTSLPQAVVVLGLRRVRDLILVDSLPVGRDSQGGLSEVSRSLWVHSVGAALASRLLALESAGGANGPGVDPEDAFLAGLFHDCGRLVLNQLAPEAFAGVWAETQEGAASVETEHATFGLAHDELGYEALSRWELPEAIRLVAREHHHDPAANDPLTRLVQAADDFVHWLELLPPEESESVGAPTDALTAAALARWRPNRPESAGAVLGLTDELLPDLAERLRLALDRETRLFLSGT